MDPNALKFFIYIVIVLSAVFHEFAHGFMAYRLGDSTAKDAGRLTLNPFAHMELMGTVVIPLFLLYFGGIFIGWAKPVPYNPFNLSDKKYGSLKVGIAGPGANIAIALILGILLRLASAGFFGALPVSGFFWQAIGLMVYINIFLALFNLIPIPPLDGSKVLMDLFPKASYVLAKLGIFGLMLALFLAFMILPALAGMIFFAITGYSFGM